MMQYKIQILCKTEQQTKLLAETFAKIAKKGDVFALFGTLGAGKSVFSRYFIQKLTDATDVPSPTFTLLQTYEAPDFEIYHYDMYRLKSPDEAYELNIEEAFFGAVSLVEWPEKILPLLPKDVWKVTISVCGTERLFNIETTNMEKYNRLKDIGLA